MRNDLVLLFWVLVLFGGGTFGVVSWLSLSTRFDRVSGTPVAEKK